MKHLFGGMEGGGTKFVCAVGTGPDDIIEEIRFPTTTPPDTLEKAVAFFKRFPVEGIGLAPFGPLDLDPASASFGSITGTPKPGWSHTEVLKVFRSHFTVPLTFDLDVNAAAFGEFYWLPENRSLNSLVYFTIGTGIGAGIIVNGKVVHGLTHPEAGHMRLPHDIRMDPFPGICPFHGDCFEGLANGPAIGKRWNQAGHDLPDEHPAWDLEATYIAFALANVIFTLSPQRIVLGGGVMERLQLFPMICKKVHEILNGYILSSTVTGSMDDYIVPPGLGKRSAILGAMAMSMSVAERS